jgi:predicted kinase
MKRSVNYDNKRTYKEEHMKPEWTRLPNESIESFRAFEVYRDMPARSIEKVAKRLGKHPTALARLSKKYDWPGRAALFDAYVGELKAEETAKSLVEMHKKHIQGAQMFQDIAFELVKELKERIERGTYPIFDDTFHDMKTVKLVDLTPKYFRMYNEAATLERTARELEERRSQPPSTTEEVTSSIENSESTESDTELIEEKIDETEEVQQDSLSQGEAGSADERPDSSEKAPTHTGILKRRSKRYRAVLVSTGSE